MVSKVAIPCFPFAAPLRLLPPPEIRNGCRRCSSGCGVPGSGRHGNGTQCAAGPGADVIDRHCRCRRGDDACADGGLRCAATAQHISTALLAPSSVMTGGVVGIAACVGFKIIRRASCVCFIVTERVLVVNSHLLCRCCGLCSLMTRRFMASGFWCYCRG